MADEKQTWWQDNKRLVYWLIAVVVNIVTATLAAKLGVQFAPVPPPVVVEVEKPAPPANNPTLDEFAPTQGWVKDDDAIAANLDPAKTLHFDRTPAGKAVLGDDDAFLWRAVRKAGKFPDTQYPSINQESVGYCVGCGWKHSCDVAQAVAIVSGAAFEWKPVSAEVIYAGSRVEVGHGQISGDGSVGAWAKEWTQSKGGMVAMQNYPGIADLSTNSPTRARQWGRTGVPDALEPEAKLHPVRGCALVTSAADAKRAIQQGYPIAVCSNQGFRMERGADGFAAPQGSWAHCMSIQGYRGGAKPGFFILNSWGDKAHTGPVWPPDMPVAGFWAAESVVDKMLRQGDSFALSDAVGFPARKPLPDWFVTRPVQPGRDLFALKPESSLSW